MKGQKGKAPAIQWYYRDWLSDTRLQMAAASTRGVWMNILMYMIDCSTDDQQCAAGELVNMSVRRICQIGSCTMEEADLFIEEALELKFCDISVTEGGTVSITSRRLSRDDKQRRKWRERKKKQRENEAGYGSVTGNVTETSSGDHATSSYSTSTSTPNGVKNHCSSGDEHHAEKPCPKDGVDYLRTKRKRKLNGKRWEAFQQFWDAFGYKKGKREAADAWLDIPELTNSLLEKIIRAAGQEAARRPKLVADGKTPKMAQGWISAMRWEDEDYEPPQQKRKYVCIPTSKN